MRRLLVLALVMLTACGRFLAADDATADAGGGGVGADAAAIEDAPSASDGGAIFQPSSCQNDFFCSGFDTALQPPYGWMRVGPSSTQTAPIAVFGLRQDAVVSAPNALHVVTVKDAPALEQWVEVTSLLDGGVADRMAGRIRVAMRVDAVPKAGSPCSAVMLNCASGGDAAQVQVLSDGAIALGKIQTAGAAVSAPAIGRWIGVDLSFQKTGTTVVSSLALSGIDVLSGEHSVVFGNCGPELRVRVGTRMVENTSAGYDLSFDDVIVDFSP